MSDLAWAGIVFVLIIIIYIQFIKLSSNVYRNDPLLESEIESLYQQSFIHNQEIGYLKREIVVLNKGNKLFNKYNMLKLKFQNLKDTSNNFVAEYEENNNLSTSYLRLKLLLSNEEDN